MVPALFFLFFVVLLIVIVLGFLAFRGKESRSKRALAHIVNFSIWVLSVVLNTKPSFIGRKKEVGKEVEIPKWYRWVLITIILGGVIILFIAVEISLR